MYLRVCTVNCSPGWQISPLILSSTSYTVINAPSIGLCTQAESVHKAKPLISRPNVYCGELEREDNYALRLRHANREFTFEEQHI